MTGNSAKTVLKLDIRDFSQQGYRERMAFLQTLLIAVEHCGVNLPSRFN